MVNPIQCNRQKRTKGLITMFEEIIASKEVKFNDLEKKVFKFVSVGNEAYPWRKPKSSKKLIISEQKLSALSILNTC